MQRGRTFRFDPFAKQGFLASRRLNVIIVVFIVLDHVVREQLANRLREPQDLKTIAITDRPNLQLTPLENMCWPNSFSR